MAKENRLERRHNREAGVFGGAWQTVRTSSIFVKTVGTLLFTAVLLLTLTPIVAAIPFRAGLGTLLIGLWAAGMALVAYHNWPLSMGLSAVHVVLLLHLNGSRLFSDAATNFSSTGLLLVLSSVLYIELLILMIYYAYKISLQRRPRPLAEHPWAGLLFRLDLTLYRLRILVIPVLYVVIVIVTILTFGQIYNDLISYTSNGLTYFSTGETIDPWDTVYFSSVTFFTIGYGDIIPQGRLLKLFVQLEMVIGHLINVFYGAILLNFVVTNITRPRRDG
ncbi:potassium channel family protein [Kyrpidia tusciae]|uniref:Ion transport 2 domain protein n=1 Tax=Kyrpidia tusciae (strain DSM 2912 / NBRC 15312 / T2) TaxID=562970 RepID=D5WRE1_KYRT2|nr:potassium channel family protein [Kyrpidia tusciae]ADG06871.1 Ion transport 2 domain protein [Kyrpidia tusciae DSM 2912]